MIRAIVTDLIVRNSIGMNSATQLLVLSRLRSGLPTHLGSLSFEGQGTFAT